MKYVMNVTIYNPEPYEGLDAEITLELVCHFHYDENQYGNGHYVSICGKGFNAQYLDIRYDASFRRNEKAKYLEEWARSYWSGKNGGYAVKEITIKEGTE